jgi:flagellin
VTPDYGATLAGSLDVTSSIGGASTSIDFSKYTGITSNNSSVVNTALTQLNNDLTASLKPTTGSTYTVQLAEGMLVINSSNVNETFSTNGALTQTPVAGTGNISMISNAGDSSIYSNLCIPSGMVINGTLKFTSTSSNGTGMAIIDMSSYSDLFGSDQNLALNAASRLQSAVNNALSSSTGVSYRVDVGADSLLIIDGGIGVAFSDAGSNLHYTLSRGGELLSVDNSSSAMLQTTVPAASVPTTIDLSGQTTATLQSFLQNQLGTNDYSVNYNNSTNSLSISLKNGNPDGYTSFSTSGSPKQIMGGSAPVTATTAVSLAGLTKTNLAAQVLAQLNSSTSNYTVSYDQTSGALSIGISAAGTSAGITSIASSANNAVETVPAGTTGLSAFNVFTSDGTGGGTNVDVTVGSLSKANVGASNGQAGVDLSASDLLSQSAAANSLTKIIAAVTGISSQRGEVGANINRLTATVSVEGTTAVNLTSAMNSIQNADIGKTVANMTQYNVLQSTGMAALQQANQAQQAVLKLIQ